MFTLVLAILPILALIIVGAALCRLKSGYVRLLVHARFPLLMGIVVCGVGPCCWQAHDLLGNLLYLEEPTSRLAGQMFHISWLSMLGATVSLAMARVTIRHAADRFPGAFNAENASDQRLQQWIESQLGTWRWGWPSWLLMLLLALPTPVCCLGYTRLYGGTERSQARLWAELVAAAIAYAVCRRLLTSYFSWRETRREPRTPPDRPSRLQQINQSLNRLLDRILGPGYVYPDEAAGSAVAPGHRWLTLLTVVLLVVYVRVGFLTGEALASQNLEQSLFPTLFFGLMAALLLGSALSAAAFYLDRYRIPVLLVSATVAFAAYALGGADHEYALRAAPDSDRAAESSLLTSEDVVADWLSPPANSRSEQKWNSPAGATGEQQVPTVVVVTAAGGGIQASAWTARVLTSLHERYGNPFAESIGLISAVSGGSVGAQYYLLAREEYARFAGQSEPLAENVLPSPKAIRAVNRAARRSGLEAVGWGVLYPDLTRLAMPSLYAATKDRGWALELSWQRTANELASELGLPPSAPPRLRDLGAATRHGLPIAAFNATLAETGQRYVMPTVRLADAATESSPYGAQYLWQLYPDSDLPLSTAVRLSSTFPIVTPMARVPKGEALREKRYYICDGGYSDNEGFVTALDWIKALARRRADNSAPLRILMVRIIPFPVAIQPKASTTGWASSWSYATAGPLLAMMAVRKSSQPERNDQLASLLAGHLGHLAPAIEFHQASFVFEPTGPDAIIPLNWKLTPRQQHEIDDGWKALLKDRDSAEPNPANPLLTIDRFFQAQDIVSIE